MSENKMKPETIEYIENITVPKTVNRLGRRLLLGMYEWTEMEGSFCCESELLTVSGVMLMPTTFTMQDFMEVDHNSGIADERGVRPRGVQTYMDEENWGYNYRYTGEVAFTPIDDMVMISRAAINQLDRWGLRGLFPRHMFRNCLVRNQRQRNLPVGAKY